MGKTIELKSSTANKKYIGIIVGGRHDYNHLVTGPIVF